MLADARIAAIYVAAKRTVLAAGYGDELSWQRSRRVSQIDEPSLLREAAWVILSSGMKETVVRAKFAAITHAFHDWRTAQEIADTEQECVDTALLHFNHSGKIGAIARTAAIIASKGVSSILLELEIDAIGALQQFPYIGPITSYHLAKNLGLPVAKADRHLVRLAKSIGCDDVQTMCRNISLFLGDPVPVVDLVLWRFATIADISDLPARTVWRISDC